MRPDPVIVDTDAGPDDLMALAYLLAHPGVKIEAVTTVGGVTPPHSGARIILSLLELARATTIPVYAGAVASRRFPGAWTRGSMLLANELLPEAADSAQGYDAVTFLRQRLQREQPPVRVLALGPLTNLAWVNPIPSWAQLVIMGGAFGVPGNVPSHRRAEWNFFANSEAADTVMQRNADMHLVPLDAGGNTPLSLSLANRIAAANGPLATFAARLVRRALHMEFAYDLLAAVALTEPRVVTQRRHGVSVREGVAQEAEHPPVSVAYAADRAIFEDAICGAFRAGV